MNGGTQTDRIIVGISLLLLATSVLLGAYGAHALPAMGFADKDLLTFRTSVFYQQLHGVCLLIWGLSRLCLKQRRNLLSFFPALLYVSGMILFCGCGYASVLIKGLDLRAIMPFGGISFVLAHISWALIILLPPPYSRSSPER